MGISSLCVRFVSGRTLLGPPSRWFFWCVGGSRSFTDECEDHVCLGGSRLAKQVIHQGDGPKLPYQAVVIRQSAMHRKGRNAIVSEGGVAPHTVQDRSPLLFASAIFKRARTAGSKSPIELAPRRRCACSCNTPATILASWLRVL